MLNLYGKKRRIKMYETNEIIPYEEPKPLTAIEIRSQVNLIQEVMKAVMQEGQHYGIIPGAGNKPTLLKPGAEKIMATFRLAANPEVFDLCFEDVIRYRVKVSLISPTNRMVGAGIGECSTEEEKYKWRAAVNENEFESFPETGRRKKWKKGKEGKADYQVMQVRTNPADIANTILKMAKKRALVDAVLTATAASDIFTQDIEDMPEEIITQKEHKPPIRQPKGKSEADNEIITVITGIGDIKMKKGGTEKEPWTKYILFAGAGEEYNTFFESVAKQAKKAKEAGLEVQIEYKKTQYGNEIVSLAVQEPQEQEPQS